MPQYIPANPDVSLQKWLQTNPEISGEYLPLALSETYEQWLEQNPNGFSCHLD